MSKSKEDLQYRIIKRFLKTLAIIPRGLLVCLAVPLGRIWYLMDRYHRGIAFDNMLKAFSNEIDKAGISHMVERLTAKFTDVIIAISATQKWELSEKLQIANPEKIRIINLGFDLEPFFDAHHFKGCLRDKLGVDNKTILIGIIGRLVPIKDHFMFLRAAKYFIENNPNVSVKFLLVGDGKLRKDAE